MTNRQERRNMIEFIVSMSCYSREQMVVMTDEEVEYLYDKTYKFVEDRREY